jgi:hypothetical protein
MPVSVDEVRALAATLPRSYEAHVRGRVKFRIGQIVYLSLAPDGSTTGCGFPKEFRQAAVDAEPEKFSLPSESDMRFNWIHVRLQQSTSRRCATSSRERGRGRCRSMSRRSTRSRKAISTTTPSAAT